VAGPSGTSAGRMADFSCTASQMWVVGFQLENLGFITSLGQPLLYRWVEALWKGDGSVLPVRRPGSRRSSSMASDECFARLYIPRRKVSRDMAFRQTIPCVSEQETVSGSHRGLEQYKCDPECAAQTPLIAPEDMETPGRKRESACANRPVPSPMTRPWCNCTASVDNQGYNPQVAMPVM